MGKDLEGLYVSLREGGRVSHRCRQCQAGRVLQPKEDEKDLWMRGPGQWP